MAKITVLGSGGWGIALALSAYNNGNEVTLWSPFEDEVNLLTQKRTNDKLLKGIIIPDDIKITTDISSITAHRKEANGTHPIAMSSASSKSLRANMRSHQSTEDACSSYSLPTSSSDIGSEY